LGRNEIDVVRGCGFCNRFQNLMAEVAQGNATYAGMSVRYGLPVISAATSVSEFGAPSRAQMAWLSERIPYSIQRPDRRLEKSGLQLVTGNPCG
jgi:hypothetical protein